MSKELCNFLDYSRSSFQTVDFLSRILDENDFVRLDEKESFDLQKGKNYYLTRNDSSIIAFKIGEALNKASFHLTASHSDCPGFKIKPNSIIKDNNYYRLNTEVYGGPIFQTWLDRPLSLAGRVIVEKNDKLLIEHIDLKRPICIIPSLAIHMNPGVNKGLELNPQVDLLPLCSCEDFNLNKILADELMFDEKQIVNYDLFLYPFEKALVWGGNNNDEFISSQHLDDLASAYASFVGFVKSQANEHINVYACFDNEEVGSLTRQGADSDFLRNTLMKVSSSLDLDYLNVLANSMMISCDNAHAKHPNHPEKADSTNHPLINHGVVIKFNANQSYTSDSLGVAIFKQILKKNNLQYQYYTNRSDMRGGSTLGNLSNAQVSLLSIDIGLAQLAMHSAYETSGLKDIDDMIESLKAFYNAEIIMSNDSIEIL